MLIKSEDVRKDVIKDLEQAYKLCSLLDMDDLAIDAISDDVYIRLNKISCSISEILSDLVNEHTPH